MNTKTKAIIAGTLLTALFAGQSAIAGQDNDQGVYAELSAKSETVMTDKVRYETPVVDTKFDTEHEVGYDVISGRK